MTGRIGTTRRTQWSAALAAAMVLQSVAPGAAQEPVVAAQGEKPDAAVPPAGPKADAAKKPGPLPKSLAAWRGKVIAHLNSRKREFNAADGTSTVAFSIDRSGKVTSARLLASSGNAALDQEAVAMTQRANPVPAPPADVVGSTLHLKVPIRFNR